MPIKEISAESVRDKSIRHGHISTLHLWWARRPLPVCRAVVFASLVPDPLDDNCPEAFKEAVQFLLGKPKRGIDHYRPYDDIPYTSAIDRMEDNLRNRLMMFIGKFSPKFCENALQGKKTSANEQLDSYSLIKWDNKDNEAIIGKARQLIWVAHNASSGKSGADLLDEFNVAYKGIKTAEEALYGTPDRHLASADIQGKQKRLDDAISAFLDRMPKVFDPFAGGGAIPLEAARLGCRSYGNDINPVAHVIQKGSVEFPQKYGKPITYSKNGFISRYGEAEWSKVPNEWKEITDGRVTGVQIPNRLSFDVGFFANELLRVTNEKVGSNYPKNSNGDFPVAYIWVRVAKCSNPSCKAEVPLLRQFTLSKQKNIHLKPTISGNKITFEIYTGRYECEGWVKRANLTCPCCANVTDASELKKQFRQGKTKEQLVAVVQNSPNGKTFSLADDVNISAIENVSEIVSKPTERMPVEYRQAMPCCNWGFTRWSDLFNRRQLSSLTGLTECLEAIRPSIGTDEFAQAVNTYLAILIDKWADYNCSFCTWHNGRDTIGHLFGKQAIPMVFDYTEIPLLSNSTGSLKNMVSWITRYIESESDNSFYAELINSASGDRFQFDQKTIAAVVTDPPYYDAIAYADLSDFFYVWLKRSLGSTYPLNFSTPQTPKSDECTALKHHHGNLTDANAHFENKLTQIFSAIEYQTSDIVSIMFAHQSTQAWTTLCNAILFSRMNITGSWPIDTELANRSLGLSAAVLASSVTVSARPAQRVGLEDFKIVRRAIYSAVENEVKDLYKLGFRGADLLTACFGKAVSEFGRFEKVEKSDGTDVTVAELLEIARESAFNALLRGFEGDDYTKFYIGWLQLYGFAESEFDDAAKFSRVGLSINVQDLFNERVLVKNGSKQTLGSFQERVKLDKNIGKKVSSSLIDKVHCAMNLYGLGDRNNLLGYLNQINATSDSSFWRVITSLMEVLPDGADDRKQANGLLSNKESLVRDMKSSTGASTTQGTIEFE
jgi:putative DNA methylase